MAPDLKKYEGLWGWLRTPEEIREDKKLEDHQDAICSDNCPYCEEEKNSTR